MTRLKPPKPFNGEAPLCPDCRQPAKPRARGYSDWKPGQWVFTCICEYEKL